MTNTIFKFNFYSFQCSFPEHLIVKKRRRCDVLSTLKSIFGFGVIYRLVMMRMLDSKGMQLDDFKRSIEGKGSIR